MKPSWILFSIISIGLFIYFIFLVPPRNFGGDIVEYFGINESLFNFGRLDLSDGVYANLRQSLNPGYFVDVDKTELNGGFLYYMAGQNGKRYPVHFFFYSALAIPPRLFLHVFGLNELNALRLTNLLILLGTIFAVMKYFIASEFKRFSFLLITLLSPLIWFVIWPGPDIFYTALVLIAIFLFFKKRYLASSAALAIASWHSQPLFVLSAIVLTYFAISKAKIQSYKEWIHFDTNIKTVLLIVFVCFLLFIPYIYNLVAFGVLTPWTILEDGWTQINGFGLKNASLQKLFEQFFDPNIGLFWYAPALLLGGAFLFVKAALKNKKLFWVLGAIITTAFFYQTNPAWHYGTSGYGPTRHILFALPFLIFIFVKYIKPTLVYFLFLVLFIAGQLWVMSYNGYLTPDFLSVLNHTPVAKFLIEKAPNLYNPTPEIFVDRTNHNDLKYIKTAIYKKDGKCIKAYVLLHDKNWLLYNCKTIPEKYLSLFDNAILGKANFPRKVKTLNATFWPDAGGCSKEYFRDDLHTFVCMRSIEDVVKYTGIKDISRIKQAPSLPNVWILEKGLPIEITVPPGYTLQYYSFDGFYVNY